MGIGGAILGAALLASSVASNRAANKQARVKPSASNSKWLNRLAPMSAVKTKTARTLPVFWKTTLTPLCRVAVRS